MDNLQTASSQTSRDIVLDLVELITNQIALVSHLTELYIDKAKLAKETANIEIESESESILNQMIKATKIRRNLMSELANSFPDNNHYYWCSLKHCIASYGFMCEILNAQPNNKNYQGMVVEVADQMIEIISKYLNIEITTCARCLSDMLAEKVEKNSLVKQ